MSWLKRTLCLFASLSSLSALAQSQLADRAPFTATLEQLRAASEAVPVDHDYGVQVLLSEAHYVIHPDRTLTFTHRLIYRVDAQDAVEGWSEISATWDPWFEKPAQLRARVLSPVGHFSELDQKTITDQPVKGDDSGTYSSEHERRAPLPGVEPGAIVEEIIETEETQPYFGAGSLYWYTIGSNAPTAFVRIAVDAPTATPLKDTLVHADGVKVTCTRDADLQHLVFEKSLVPAHRSGDIELNTNDPEVPMVQFATGESWRAVAEAYAAMADPQIVPAETAPILPTDLPAGRIAKIRAITARLHQEVRYTGIEFGAAKLTPNRPSQVLERHYGDCKDKATFLVAMLRQAGIPAHVALLQTGPGNDVRDDLPGMNRFNHAIVYVPAAAGAGEDNRALWIDATATYFQPGILPWEDSGRRALIIAPNTTGLTTTPAPAQSASTLTETRDFHLAAFGPSTVTETSETHGIIDANYRGFYGASDPKKVQADLESYVQSAYYAKKLVTVNHGEAPDLSQPFHLTLNVEGARRGITEMDEAVVAIFPNLVLDSFPRWFRQQPPSITPETPPQTRHLLELSSARRLSSYVYRPFVDERRIIITPPHGFKLRTLPAAKTTELGIAKLTESYTASPDGNVTVVLHLDSGTGTLTAEQALKMRDAVLEYQKREFIGIYFDQTAAKAFAAGRIREALTTDKALISAEPNEAIHHVRLSRLLLDAGIGDAAHTEARRATELDPKSAVAWRNLGWSLEHDELGERFGKGFDLAGGLDAYKKAVALDPDDDDAPFDLAVLYEFNARGQRYGAGADLKSAEATYRALIDKNKDKDASVLAQPRTNLMYALLFDGKYAELEKLIASLPYTNAHAQLAIAAATVQHGAPAGVAQAEKGNIAASDRNKNLLVAADLCAQLRHYPEAAALLEAGIAGGTDANAIGRQIEMYKSLKPVSFKPLPASDPAGPVQTLMVGMMAGTLTRDQARNVLARTAYVSETTLDFDADRNLASSGFLRATAATSEFTEGVLLDLIAGNFTYQSSGDDETGYKVILQEPGSAPRHFFVVKEDGAFRIVADDGDNVQVGVAVVHALDANKLKLAKSLLDWKRDLVHREGNDDPFFGPLLPRFWTVGSTKPGADSPENMRLAAYALMAGSMAMKPHLAEIQAARDKASGARQTDLDLLLACAAALAEEADLALAASKRLLEQEPESATALRFAGLGYSYKHDSADYIAMMKALVARKPTDHDLLEIEADAYDTAKDYATARKVLQAALDSGKATANDYNSFAWHGLFDGHTGEDALKAAQQSTMQSKQGSFADLHTLACIYAVEGKTTEARKTLQQAMSAGSQVQPNSAVWYALGLIYEQYGVNDAALAAYKKVEAHEFDDHTYIEPMSTYLLAQQRIAALAH